MPIVHKEWVARPESSTGVAVALAMFTTPFPERQGVPPSVGVPLCR